MCGLVNRGALGLYIVVAQEKVTMALLRRALQMKVLMQIYQSGKF